MITQPDGRPRTALHRRARGDWRQTPDATRGEHDRIRTGGPPARHRRSRSLPVIKLGMRKCGVAPAMKRATGPTAKGRAHPHRGRTRVARRPRPACTFATPGHRRVPGGDERDGRPVRRPRRAAQPRTRISEAGRRSPRRTGGRTGRQESGTSPPGNRPKRTDHRQRRHVHDRHPAASPREPRGPAPRPDDRADEDLRDRSRRRGSMTAARSPWAWSSCCSQVALRRAIAHPPAFRVIQVRERS